MELSEAQKRLLYRTPPVLMLGGMAYGVKTRIMSQKIFLIKRTKLLQSKSKQCRMIRVVIK